MKEKNAIGGLTTARIETLSDSIFAFAMTLLVLDLRLPEIPVSSVVSELPHRLLALWPKFFTYVISFMILGVGWVGHHNMFHYIRRSDRIFLWLNIFYLMGAASFPFATSVVGAYGQDPLAVVLFGSDLILIASSLYCTWWYATYRHRLVDRDLNPEIVRLVKRRILGGIVIYSLIMIIALFHAKFSMFLFFLVPLVYIFPGRLDRHFGEL